MNEPAEIITPEPPNSIPPDQAELVERLCQEIVRRHLAIPALVILEIVRPLSGLSLQVLDALAPFLDRLHWSELPPGDIHSTVPAHRVLAEFLTRPDSIEFLCHRIETLEQQRAAADLEPGSE